MSPSSPCRSPLTAMEAQFTLDYQVMYYDTDCGGVVHNLAYLRWVEEARTKMGDALGINYADLAKENRHLVLVRHEVDYHSPAFLADKIKVQGMLIKAEGASLYFRFEIRRAENDKLCVTVHQRLGLVQMPQGRPQRIPADWRDKCATLTQA